MNNIDKAVGIRIKTRRKTLKLSQTDLADRIGVKFQQVQKYESGTNRVAASRLWQMADALDVHVSYFFDDLEVKDTATLEMAGVNAFENQFEDLKRSLACVSEPQRKAILALIETFQYKSTDQKPI